MSLNPRFLSMSLSAPLIADMLAQPYLEHADNTTFSSNAMKYVSASHLVSQTTP